MRRYITPKWIVVSLIVLAILLYFVFRFGDVQFRDAAIANLFATVAGILLGVPIALEINRHQEEARSKLEDEARSTEQQQRIRALYRRLKEELNLNLQRLDRLSSALDESNASRTDHWDWVMAIADSFSFDAYGDLQVSQTRNMLPWDLDFSIQIAFPLLRGLTQRVREANAAQAFYTGHTADQPKADAELHFVRDLARETRRRVEECKELIIRYGSLFPSP